MNSKASFNPYPGLRPFREDETLLFFGRDRPTRELVGRLARNRFLAVIGASGSGKSSLVKCGVVPALEAGLIVNAGSRWRIADFRPGGAPIAALAQALAGASVTGPGTEGSAGAGSREVEAVLRHSDRGLIEAIRRSSLSDGETLLVLVDQFEELFRYGGASRGDVDEESIAFVKLLLRAIEETRTTDLRLYVMITMRSDFLGDCMLIRGLPDAVNSGSYLIPSMNREERREAIEGPAEIRSVKVAPRLVQRILNDVGENLDQLPLMQHALMRTWDRWAATSEETESIDLEHYVQVGGIRDALGRHADQVLAELAPQQRGFAEGLFKAITARDEDRRRIRRPARLREIVELTAAGPAELAGPIDAFRAPGRTFLMPPADVELEPETVIDVSHESLIRNWRQLRDWLDEEADQADFYKELARTAAEPEATKYRGAKLQRAREWRARVKPTRTWAARYPIFAGREPTDKEADYIRAMSFLDASVRAWVTRWIVAGAAVVFCFAVVLAFAAYRNAQAAAAERALRAQTAGALEDRLVGALILADMRDEPPPDGGDTIALKILEAGFPLAALPEPDTVRSFALAAGDSALLVGSIDNTPDGRRGRIRYWKVDGRSAADTLRNSVSELPELVATADGRAVAFLSDDRDPTWGSIATWDPGRDDPRLVATLQSLSDSAGAAVGANASGVASAFTRDAARLAIAYRSGVVAIWRADSANAPDTVRHAGVEYVDFSADGRWLATVAPGDAPILWDLTTAPPRREQLSSATGGIAFAAFGGGDELLLTTGENATAIVLALGDGSPGRLTPLTVLSGHTGDVRGGGFSPDGSLVVTASNDSTARVWKTAGGDQQHVLRGHEDRVLTAGFSPDGSQILTTSDDGTARLWDTLSGTLLSTFSGHSGRPKARFSADGARVVTGATRGGVRVWPSTGIEWGRALPGHSSSVPLLAATGDGFTVLSGSRDKTARVWIDSTGARPPGMKEYSRRPRALALTPDGAFAAVGVGDTVWVGPSGALDSLRAVGLPARVEGVAFAADQMYVLTSDGVVRVFDPATLAATDSIMPPEGENSIPSGGLILDPTGKSMLVAYQDDEVSRRRVVSGTYPEIGDPIKLDAELAAAVFARNGEVIAVAADSVASVYPLEASQAEVEVHHLDRIAGLAFSPDGAWLVTVGGPSIAVWDTRTGRRVAVVRSRDGNLENAVFMGDPERLLTSAQSGTLRVWPMSWRGLATSIRTATSACLSAEQRVTYLGESNTKAGSAAAKCRAEQAGGQQ